MFVIGEMASKRRTISRCGVWRLKVSDNQEFMLPSPRLLCGGSHSALLDPQRGLHQPDKADNRFEVLKVYGDINWRRAFFVSTARAYSAISGKHAKYVGAHNPTPRDPGTSERERNC